jgi:hypothetical protein
MTNKLLVIRLFVPLLSKLKRVKLIGLTNIFLHVSLLDSGKINLNRKIFKHRDLMKEISDEVPATNQFILIVKRLGRYLAIC